MYSTFRAGVIIMGILTWLTGGTAEAGTNRLKASELLQKINAGLRAILSISEEAG